MLAFVPAGEVRGSFYSLLDELPDELQIDVLLAYFQTTWIEGLSAGRRAPGNALFPPQTVSIGPWLSSHGQTTSWKPGTRNSPDSLATPTRLSGITMSHNITLTTFTETWAVVSYVGRSVLPKIRLGRSVHTNLKSRP